MISKLFSKTINEDFVIVDSQFPQKIPLGFRNIEINEYLRRISNAVSYTMPPMSPGKDAWFRHGYGVPKEVFLENKEGYLKLFPKNENKIRWASGSDKYSFGLAYSFFLAETYVLLPFYEKHRIPFVFVLYPGGGFGLNNASSDAMLKKIFESKYFRNVIVTQQITKDYLIQRKLCAEEKITYIYGGFVQFEKHEVLQRKYFAKDKKVLDICFVAAKYSERGVDKGYDTFIDVAKAICEKTDDINFHVVGGFGEDDIDTKSISGRITFYGFRTSEFLKEFYSRMDIFLSPGRPNILFEGSFDGFPLGIDAGYCGVALFVSDELRMNNIYKEGAEIIILPLSSQKIVEKILYYHKNPLGLISLAQAGQRRTQALFDTDFQIRERIKVFNKYNKLNVDSNEKEDL